MDPSNIFSCVVFPPSQSALLSVNILGLSLKDRVKKSALKNGFENIVFLSGGSSEFSFSQDKILVQNFGVLFKNSAWKILKKCEPEQESIIFFEGAPQFCLIRSKNPAVFQELKAGSLTGGGQLERLKGLLKVQVLSFPADSWISFNHPSQFKTVENWLLKSLIKENEGFMSRHLERKISLAVSRRLVHFNITPNQMTLLSVLIGVGGSIFFIFPEKWYHVLGAFLFWLHSVLDGCDGEIARLKFLESRFGGVLDFWGDNVVHSAVFGMIALGLFQSSTQLYPLLLGFLAVGGALLSAGWVYKTVLFPQKNPGPLFTFVVQGKNRLERIADFLARRDFIYLALVLAWMGRIEWFLWMGAIGSPVYFLVIFISSRLQKT